MWNSPHIQLLSASKKNMDFKVSNLKLKYGERCRTKSKNSAVLEVYDFILQNENVDTDYWWTDCGPQDLNIIFEACFTELDWNELEVDLKYWTTNQLEIFLYAIMNGYTYNLIHDSIFKEKPGLAKEVTRIIPNKTDLILPILNIGIERGQLKNDIILTAQEEIYFLINHFDVLIDKDPNYLNKIKDIVDVIGYDYIMQENPELKNKIEKASR